MEKLIFVWFIYILERTHQVLSFNKLNILFILIIMFLRSENCVPFSPYSIKYDFIYLWYSMQLKTITITITFILSWAKSYHMPCSFLFQVKIKHLDQIKTLVIQRKIQLFQWIESIWNRRELHFSLNFQRLDYVQLLTFIPVSNRKLINTYYSV